MKLLIIHLSDMHFENTEQTHSIHIDKIMEAILSKLNADECVITISGDMASEGKKSNYKFVRGFIAALLKELKTRGFRNKKIHVLLSPGNHDIDFSNLKIDIRGIEEAYKTNNAEKIEKQYIDSMSEFFLYATEQGCFVDDKIISSKVIEYEDKRIGFVLYNTAPFSLLGGQAEDMGKHYLSDRALQKLDDATDADINILVSHHSIEWLKTEYKNKLRKIISQNYSLVLSGHEHYPFGQSNSIDNNKNVQFVQGNALYGCTEEGNGFCAITIDMDNYYIEGYSFLWKNNIYVPEKIIDAKVRRQVYGNIELQDEYYKQIAYDSFKRKIDDYYVFPGITYNKLDEKNNVQRYDMDEELELFELLDRRSRTIITGAHKAGKSLLAKRIILHYYDMGKKPLLIEASGINKRKIA